MNREPWASRRDRGDRRGHGGTVRQVIYGLWSPITYEGQEVHHVVVSHGTYGDTGIFPCEPDGKVIDYLGLWMEDHVHVPHDAAFTAWIEGETRPGILQSGFGIRPDVVMPDAQ